MLPGVAPFFFTGNTALSSDDMVFGNVGDAPYADRIYAMNVHFQVSNATIQGAVKPESMAVRWMFYPNGPVWRRRRAHRISGLSCPARKYRHI